MLVGALYNSQKGNNKGVRHLMKVKKKKKKVLSVQQNVIQS